MLALEDVRVIAIEQYGAGPWATLQLADMGADIIKIEDPTTSGDVGRIVPPYQEGEHSLFFETFNRGKRSVTLDLRSPEGRSAFERLVRDADAVFSNLRGDGPKKLRITYDDLRELNPRIVCVSLSGFGNTGPRSTEAGYDYTVQGLTGWMSLTGDPNGPPTKSGLSLVDWSGGYTAAIAMLGALWRARRDGVGCDCDVSLFETALHELAYLGTWAASREYQPTRMPESAHPSIVPFQVFATADGWITVACPKQKFWRLLCQALDRPDLLEDERYVDLGARSRHRDDVLQTLRPIFAAETTEHWQELLGKAGVPNGPINDVGAALQDPQVAARGSIATYEHPVLGSVRQVTSPLRVDGRAPQVTRAPFLGEHNDIILGRANSDDPRDDSRGVPAEVPRPMR